MQFLHKSQYAKIALVMIILVIKMYQRIRDLREDKDLSQKQIAKILNISQSTYSRYESGYLDVPSEILILLSKYYSCICGLYTWVNRPKAYRTIIKLISIGFNFYLLKFNSHVPKQTHTVPCFRCSIRNPMCNNTLDTVQNPL